MRSTYYLFLLPFLLHPFFSCNEVNPKGEKEVREFVKQWNADHTQLKSPYLERDYMDVVTYYGKERTKNQVQEDKNVLFQQFPDYNQSILNDTLNIIKEEGIFLVTFTIHVSYDGIESDYPLYLAVTIRNGVFKILREDVAKNAKNIDAPIFPKEREKNEIITNKRQLFGDFNGDGLSDYATVVSPEIITNSQTKDSIKCKDGCNSVINFSNKNLQPITIEGSYKSELENLKDLNSDTADEIGFWDIKPNSKTLYVFNASTGALLCDPIFINTNVHKNLKLIDVFKKTGPNKITVTYSEEVNGKWVLKSDVIILN